MVAFAVPLTALQVWAAIELLRGAGWARILLTVVAGLSALGAPLDLSGLILAGLALTLAGAALMWTPAANRFFLLRRNVGAYPVPADAGPDPAVKDTALKDGALKGGLL